MAINLGPPPRQRNRIGVPKAGRNFRKKPEKHRLTWLQDDDDYEYVLRVRRTTTTISRKQSYS